MTLSTSMMSWLDNLVVSGLHAKSHASNEEAWNKVLEDAYMLLRAASEAGCPLMSWPLLAEFPRAGVVMADSVGANDE